MRLYKVEPRCGRAEHQGTYWIETDARGLDWRGSRGSWTAPYGTRVEVQYPLIWGKCCVMVEVTEVTRAP